MKQKQALHAAFLASTRPADVPFVYVAGPFRAKTRWEIESNIRLAEDYSMRLWSLGIPNLCPHTIGRFLDGTLEDSFILPVMLGLMYKCEAVFLVSGWERSKGAVAEVRAARERGIPCFSSVETLQRFLSSKR